MSPKKNDKNQQNPVDKIFREGLHDRSFNFDEKNWENAESMLNDFNQMKATGKSGRNKKLWLLGGVFLAVGLLAVLLIKPWNSNKTSEHNQITTALEEEKVEKKPNEKLKQINDSKSSEKIENNSDNSQTPDNQPIAIENSIPNEQKSTDKRLISANRQPEEATTGSNNASNGASNQKQDATKANMPKDEQQPKGVIEVDKQSANNPNNEVLGNLSQNDNNENPNSEITATDTGDSKINERNSLSEITTEEQQEDTLPIAAIDTATLEPNVISNKPKKQKADISTTWFIEPGFGITFLNQQLTSTNPDLNDWIAYRSNNELLKPSAEISVFGGIAVNNFTISTGAILLGVSSNVDYNFTYLISDTTYEYLYDTSGLVTDTIEIINIDTFGNAYNGVNKLSYVEIPFLVGYRFEQDKWSFGVQTGPSLGILRQSEIKYPTTDLTNIADINISYFKKTTFNWIAKPSVQYRINDNIAVGLSSILKWNLNSISNDVDVIEKYNSTSIEAGLHIKF